MFGYVKVFKPELKIVQYETYKAFYCSVCKELGHSYTPAAQLLLNYDIVFFLILKDALLAEKPCFVKKYCSFNPLKKCHCVQESQLVKTAANLLIISAYHKLRDDIKDERGLKRLLQFIIYPYFYLMWKRAKKREPEFEKIISQAMKTQAIVEQGEDLSIDASAHPSADALGLIFCSGEEGENKDILYRLGYMVGRWVYIMDAADDIEKDLKVKRFNPLKSLYLEDKSEMKSNFNNKALEILRATVQEARLALNLLDIKRNKPILENILNEGFNFSQACILRIERGCKHEYSL